MAMSASPIAIGSVAAELGEGPVWRAGALWFVDIKGRRIHRLSPQTGETVSWDAPAQPGFIAPLVGGDWIAGLQDGLHRFDPESGDFSHLRSVEDPALGNRLNDSFVDARGRLWFGSMHDDERLLTGALYRLDGAGLTRLDDGYCITNGPAASPDGRSLYHTDTLARRIYVFDLDAAGGLTNRRVFVQLEAGAGYPDGPTVDAQGCVWTGLFGGWGVRRYSPSGDLLATIAFPVANITKIAFGGEDLRTIYATTAWKGLSEAQRAAQPLAGRVFTFKAETPGLPQNEVLHA